MGTSSARGGPSDTARLLPSWARPEAAPGGGDVATPAGGEGAASGDNGEGNAGGNVQLVQPTAPTPVWGRAKGAMTRAAHASGRGRRQSIARAAASYVRARGGARRAASGARVGRTVATRLGGFVSAVAREGIGPALRAFDLGSYVGKGADEVFAALADALAPPGADVDGAAARAAVGKGLSLLYERVVAAGGDLSVLDSMTADELVAAVEICVSAFIYEQWVGQLGQAIERGSVSEETAVDLESGMREYVRESVKMELDGRNASQIDWAGREGKALIDKVFQDSYSFLEGGG